MASGSNLLGRYFGDTEKNIESLFLTAENTVKELCLDVKRSGRDVNLENLKNQYARKVIVDDSSKSKESVVYDDDQLVGYNDDKCKGVSFIFIDEADSLAGNRASGNDSSSEKATNQLIQMMDGAVVFKYIVTIMATNRPWDLDSAVLSRLPVKLFVDVLDDDSRFKLFMSLITQKLKYCLKFIRIPDEDISTYNDKELFSMFGLDIKEWQKFVNFFLELTGVDDGAILDENLNIVKDFSADDLNQLFEFKGNFESKTEDNPEPTLTKEFNFRWRYNKDIRKEIVSSASKSRIVISKQTDPFIFKRWLPETQIRDFYPKKKENGITGSRFGYTNRDIASIFSTYMADASERLISISENEEFKKEKLFRGIKLGNDSDQVIFFLDKTQVAEKQYYSYEEIEGYGLVDRILTLEPFGAEKKEDILVKAVKKIPSSVKPMEYLELQFYNQFGERL
jgi:SpoVK/Ycf46/Vps4 family AAA+-type ATPase